MPIYENGYRPLPAEEMPGRARWLALPQAEIRFLFKKWKMILLFALCNIPSLVLFVLMLLSFGLLEFSSGRGRGRSRGLSGLLDTTDLESFRGFLLDPMAMVIVVVFLAATAVLTVSRDRQNGALELYFTRPIRVYHYVFGRWLGAAFMIAAVTSIPIILIWFLGALVAPDWGYFCTTWHIPLRIASQGVFFSGVLGICVVAISSLSALSWTCQVLWVGFIAIMHMVVSFGLRRFLQAEWPVYFSPWGVLQRVSESILGITPEHPSLALVGSWITGPAHWLYHDILGFGEPLVVTGSEPLFGCLELSLVLVLLSVAVLRKTLKPVEVVG